MVWCKLALGLVLLGASAGARAQVYEWRDAAGARHFTNNLELVPAARQASVRVVVREEPRSAATPREPAAVPAAEAAPPRRAQVVYGSSYDWEDGYAEGMQRGLAAAGGGGGGGGAAVQLNGPLAVARSQASGGYLDYPYLGYPDAYPFVTTSFDRGRSRHLTLRMLLQDQFQIDRDGPFRFARFPSGAGPGLRPFLPRGLPHGFPRRQRAVTSYPLARGVRYR